MNLFCFTLEGSSESIYEPVNSHTLKEFLPKSQCSSGSLRCKAEWGGSDPSINSDKNHTKTRPIGENRRSRKAKITLEDETFVCSDSRVLTRHVQKKETVSERRRTDLPAQNGEKGTDSDETIQTTGKLKKLQNLVHVKNGPKNVNDNNTSSTKKHACMEEGVRHHSTGLTCISLSRRTEKSSSEAVSPSHPHQLQQNTRNSHEDTTERGFWSPKMGHYRRKPFECPEAWPFQHTCHQVPHQLCTHSGNSSSPPWNSDWDRFESVIQELSQKQSDLSLSQMIRSLTDMQCSENTNIYMENDKAAKRETGHRGTCTKGHKQSRSSLESIYSLKSGQSSSSGVTSGSNCSSNRESLRLEDDLMFTRQFCCRARVHTEFVPSLYDTESLTLKVGDIIDVIAKPPMGTWTGLLNGRIGNFKFIYVDVLTHSSGTNLDEVKETSAVQEVLRRLSLEEYFSSLHLNGYQTVDDLMKLRESNLVELNVTDPEHRERLLTAVHSLQQLDSEMSRDVKGDMNSCPRDSGCLETSDSPENCTEDTHSHVLPEYTAMLDILVL